MLTAEPAAPADAKQENTNGTSATSLAAAARQPHANTYNAEWLLLVDLCFVRHHLVQLGAEAFYHTNTTYFSRNPCRINTPLALVVGGAYDAKIDYSTSWLSLSHR